MRRIRFFSHVHINIRWEIQKDAETDENLHFQHTEPEFMEVKQRVWELSRGMEEEWRVLLTEGYSHLMTTNMAIFFFTYNMIKRTGKNYDRNCIFIHYNESGKGFIEHHIVYFYKTRDFFNEHPGSISIVGWVTAYASCSCSHIYYFKKKNLFFLFDNYA